MLQKVSQQFPQVHNYVLPAKQNNPIPVLLQIPPNAFCTPSVPKQTLTGGTVKSHMNLPQMTNPTKFIDDISAPSTLANFLKLKTQMAIQAVLEEEDGYILKKMLIPELTKRNEAHRNQSH